MGGSGGQRRQAWVALLLGLGGAAYDPSATASAVKTTLTLLAAVVLVALTLPSWLRGDRAISSRAGLLWLSLCGWLAVSLWRSPYHSDVIVLGPWLAAAGISLGLAGLSAAELRRLGGRTATVLAATSSAAALAQAAAGARGSTLHGLQGNPNWLGLVLACALPLIVDRHRELGRAGGRGERWATALTLVSSLAALALSQSRAAWLGLALAALVVARGRWRLATLGAAGIGMALSALKGDLLGAWEGRLWLWRVAARGAFDAPWLGHGTGSFPFVYLEQQGALLKQLPLEQAAVRFVNATSAHNDWLQLWSEVGLLGPCLLAAVLAFGFWDCRRSWPGAAAAMVVVAVSALGDTPLSLPAVVVLLAPAFAVGPPALAVGPPVLPRRLDAGLVMTVLVAAALLLSRGSSDWLGERRLTRALLLLPGERLQLLSRTAAAAPHHGEASLALGLALLEGGQPDLALPFLHRSKTQLANPSTAIAIGNAHASAGRPAEAIASYSAALRLHPASLSAHLNLAEALRRSGRLAEATVHLDAARELWPHHPQVTQLAEQLRRDRIDAADGQPSPRLDSPNP